MKKTFFYYLFAVLCTVTFMTSCSDDDDPSYPIDEEIAGTYKGALDITLEGTPIASGLPKNITITKASNSTVNMELKDFAFMGMNLGTITLKDCAVSQEGTSYSFTSEQTLTLSSEIGSCLIKVNGTITGTKATINLDIEVTKLNQKVKVVYTGTRLSGSESAEAKITSFIFDRKVAAVDSLVVSAPIIDEAKKTITFMVADTAKAEHLKMLVPTIVISEKATLSPASGIAQNFNAPVTYTVVAENGTVVEYTASISSKGRIYDFEDWTAGVKDQEPENTFYEPSGWSSSNTGAHFLKAFGLTDKYVINQTNDAHSGKSAAIVQSIDTQGKDLWLAVAPKVTTGSLFLGAFITDISSTLNSTKFGIPYTNKPVSLKGWYKYTPGTDFYVCEAPYDKKCDKATIDPTKKDEFAIKVVLYTTDEYKKDWSDCLTGVYADDSKNPDKNIYASSRVVAIGSLEGGAQADWKQFDIKLNYSKDFDPSKKYRFTIVCSSSKEGDKFWGAPGSTLTVDDFELTVE